MLTYRKMTIPIFEVELKVYIFDNWSEVSDIAGEGNKAKGVTFYQDGIGKITVVIDKRHPSTIVHEAEHVKNFIWNYIGYTPQRDNDEVDAYLLKYLYNKIVDVFYKHIGKNPKDIFR